jgi:hypothetical protein
MILVLQTIGLTLLGAVIGAVLIWLYYASGWSRRFY